MAPILVTLNSRDMKARTACSALPGRTRTLAMASGCLLYSLGIWLLFLLLGLVFYRKAMLQPYVGYAILNSLAFLLFTTALSLLISTFSPDDNVLNMLANIVGLSMSFLCGVFVPQSMLSGSVLAVGRFLPAYWYIRANNMLAGLRPRLLLEMHRHPVPLCRRHVRPDCCRSETEKGAVALSEPPLLN